MNAIFLYDNIYHVKEIEIFFYFRIFFRLFNVVSFEYLDKNLFQK